MATVEPLEWEPDSPWGSRRASRALVSVVVPVYNEEACLEALLARLTRVLETATTDYEIVLIDDGSGDRSADIMRQWAERDPRVGFQRFSRNFGHEAATTCGLLAARGQAVVLIDADLQDPPELIPVLLERWRHGYDVVYAQRRGRDGETWLTRGTSHLFYRLLKLLARVDVPKDTGDFRLLDRAVVDAFARLPERCRFVRGLLSWVGFRQTAVVYNRDARLAGATKYGFGKRLHLAVDALCGLSDAPLRWVGVLGFVLLLSAAGIGAGAIANAVVTGASAMVGLLAAGLVAMGGAQLLASGVLGEYVCRSYRESQGRPLFIVAERRSPTGFQAADEMGDESEALDPSPAYSQAG